MKKNPRNQIKVGDKVYSRSLHMPRPHESHDMTVIAVHHGGKIVETNKGMVPAVELGVRR